jgi:hypothetical protein
MPQTRGRSSTRKDESSHEKPKAKRGRGRNNTSQDEQFQTSTNCGRGRGRGRGKNDASLTKKKPHLLNEILEDSDYDKDPMESSLSRPFNLLSPINTRTSIVLDDLDSVSAPRPESRDLNSLASLRDVHRNMDEFDSTSAPRPESLQEINRNTDELENLSAPSRPRSRNLDFSTPLREVPRSRNSTPLQEINRNTDELENLSAPSRPRSRSLDISTPLREVHRNTDEVDSASAPSRPGSRDLNTSVSIRSFNTPTLPPCFNDMDTIFQLATWLCANPNVLQFANAIYSSMQMSLANGQPFTPANLTNPTTLQLQSPLQVRILWFLS